MPVLDKTDRRLLLELDRNSREPFATISKRLRVSEETLRYRFARLEETKIILSTLAVIDAGKLGASYFKVLIKLHNIDESTVSKLIRSLTDNASVNWVARLDGLYDVGFTIRVERIVELSNFLDQLKSNNHQYIHRLVVAINIQVDFLPRDYLLQRTSRIDKRVAYTTPKALVTVDELDSAILRILATDTRKPAAAIARTTGVTTETILQRIRKLEERGVILRYIITLNPGAAGILNYYTLLYLNNVSEERLGEFREHCLRHPNMVYLIKALGEWDFELNVEVEDVREYRALMMDLTRQFSDIIRDYYTLHVLELHKFTLAP